MKIWIIINIFCNIIFNYNISSDLHDLIFQINNKLCNKQFITINSIISYIEKKDYFGEDYHKYKNIQIENSKFWLKIFYQNDYKQIKKLKDTILKK